MPAPGNRRGEPPTPNRSPLTKEEIAQLVNHDTLRETRVGYMKNRHVFVLLYPLNSRFSCNSHPDFSAIDASKAIAHLLNSSSHRQIQKRPKIVKICQPCCTTL